MLGHKACLKYTGPKETSGMKSTKGLHKKSASLRKSSSFNGEVQNEKKYCVFTTKERSNLVVANENAIPGKLINEQLNDVQDLKYFQ